MADFNSAAQMQGASSTLTLGGSTFPVGFQGSTSGLKSVSSIAGTEGFFLRDKVLHVTKDGAVISEVDLRGFSVAVDADNVTIRNSLASASGWYTIDQYSGHSGLTVEHSTFDGMKQGTNTGYIISSRGGAMNIRNNEFFNVPSDVIQTYGGTVEKNFISGGGYKSGAHADGIVVHGTSAPVRIVDNYIDWVSRSDAPEETNNAVRISPEFGAIKDVLVEGNVILGGGYTVFATGSAYGASNVRIVDNDIGFGKWGPLYKASKYPASFFYSGKENFSTSEDLARGGSATPASTETVSESVSAGAASISTTPYPSGTINGTESRDHVSGTSGNDVIVLKGGSDIVNAGSGNDIIVGGLGKDFLSGQAGDDAFVYTSIRESGPAVGARDVISAWGAGLHGRGNDTIDLRLIDADAAASGDQGFKWIGSSAFAGKAGELRAEFDGTNTIVMGTVNADKSADFHIQINGRVDLTTADFLL